PTQLQFDTVQSHGGLERSPDLAHGQLVESDFFYSTDELSPANPTDITTFSLSRPLRVLSSQFRKIRSGNDAFVQLHRLLVGRLHFFRCRPLSNRHQNMTQTH